MTKKNIMSMDNGQSTFVRGILEFGNRKNGKGTGYAIDLIVCSVLAKNGDLEATKRLGELLSEVKYD